MEKTGLLPVRRRLGKGSVEWILSEVKEWINSR
jgi:predicted DNA-binding transcriptional regulator AlpA